MVQSREKYGHSNITVNSNYYGQQLASKLPVFDRKSYMGFFKSVHKYAHEMYIQRSLYNYVANLARGYSQHQNVYKLYTWVSQPGHSSDGQKICLGCITCQIL